MDAATARDLLRTLADQAKAGADALESVADAETRLAEISADARRAESTRDAAAAAVRQMSDEITALDAKHRTLLADIDGAATQARATYLDALGKAKRDLDETVRLRAEEQERRSQDAKSFLVAQEKGKRDHAQALDGMRQEVAEARRRADADLSAIATEVAKAQGVLEGAKAEHAALVQRLAGAGEAP